MLGNSFKKSVPRLWRLEWTAFRLKVLNFSLPFRLHRNGVTKSALPDKL